MKIKRSQLKEMVKRMLREGNSFQDSYDKWQELLYTVGADTMLDCIFTWASIDQKEQWLEWFEDEGYIDGYMSDNDDPYSNAAAYSKWQEVLELNGADTMLDCLYQWASSDESDQWIEWFEEEGYIDFGDYDDEDEEDDDMYESRNRRSKRTINEVSGWTLEEDDIEWVNDKGDDYYDDDDAWIVRLWPGSGYYLPAFGVYANHEEEALNLVVAYLDQKGDDSFFVDDYVDSMRDQMEEEGADEETIWDLIDNDDTIMYVDATIEGANAPHYIYAENLNIYPYSNFKNEG